MRLVSLHFVLTFEKGAQISVNFVLYTKPDSDLRVWKKFCSNIWKKIIKMRLVSLNFVTAIEKGSQISVEFVR